MRDGLIYDRIINAPRAKTASATLLICNSLQDYIEAHPGVQVLATAAAFLLLCERFGVPAQDAFTAAKNLMNAHEGAAGKDFAAVREYLANEVK